MSVVKSIELVLPKDAIYLAGSSLKGQVILILNSTLVDPIVKVELVGRGYVEWNEETGASRDYSRDVICNNKADYMHKTKTFPVEDNWLSAGNHTFDFHFNLPPRLPSTFTSKIGRVFYYVQASCMGRELILAKKRMYLLVQGTSDFHSESPFQVSWLVASATGIELLEARDSVNTLGCTGQPQPKEGFRLHVTCAETEAPANPLLVEAKKRVSYNCCSHGTVHLQIYMEKNIFTPGDRVIFTTEINNQTSKCIKTVLFALYAHVQYEGFTPKTEQRTCRDCSELLRQEAHTHITPFNTTKVVNTFYLPLVLSVSSSSRQQDSEIMRTQYELVITVHLPWSLTTVRAKVPIIITSCQLLDGEEPGSQS